MKEEEEEEKKIFIIDFKNENKKQSSPYQIAQT
jgi:hypothetical protein